jgi:hypothetical protein
MCHQSVGLIQAAVERVGIATVSVSLAREITLKVRPPRALFVPFAFGYPLGRPQDSGVQSRIALAALELLEREGPGPVYADFDESVGGRQEA